MGEAELKPDRAMIVPVPPEYVDQVWPDIEGYIEMALKRSNGELWLEDVYRFLKDATLQAALCVVDNKLVAAVVTEIIEYPRKKAVRLILGGGSHLHEWGPELDAAMQQRAEEVGADLIEVQGRMGWIKVLKKQSSAKVRSVMMTRRVNG